MSALLSRAVGIWVVNLVPSLSSPLIAPLSVISTVWTWPTSTFPAKNAQQHHRIAAGSSQRRQGDGGVGAGFGGSRGGPGLARPRVPGGKAPRRGRLVHSSLRAPSSVVAATEGRADRST
nr:hypothetical protein [Streptomyces sp. TLI_235]